MTVRELDDLIERELAKGPRSPAAIALVANGQCTVYDARAALRILCRNGRVKERGTDMFTLAIPKTVDEAIARAKLEVLSDVATGKVPPTCATFGELHNYVDANYYGGAFEEGAPEPTNTDFWNAVQDAIDTWIKQGALTK